MYCPNCATRLSGDQKFCRSCGLDLHVISHIFTNVLEMDKSSEVDSADTRSFQSRKAKLKMQGTIILMSALPIGCLIPISLGLFPNWAALSQLIMVLSGVAGLLLFAGIIVLVYGELLPQTQLERESSRLTSLRGAAPTNQLPPVGQSEPVPGVTEGTTDLLDIPVGK